MFQCISPIDGRYRDKTIVLNKYFSEYAFIKYRLLIEIKYLIELSKYDIIVLNNKLEKLLYNIYENFDLIECNRVKKIELSCNHDVKAIEYYLREKLKQYNFDINIINHIHFALTSQDVNSTANILSLKDSMKNIIIPKLNEIITILTQFCHNNKDIMLLSKTHGQPATQTTLGKEYCVFAERLSNQMFLLSNNTYSTKFGGAVGNFNAHYFCYPEIEWEKFSNTFLDTFGLKRNINTTQIDHYDNYSYVLDIIKRISVIFIDLCQDSWLYISRGVLGQKIKKEEVGSSTMPHKVNPINFENAEGNFYITISLIEGITRKLPISRMQRDLSDSTILRNLGVVISHFYIGLLSVISGMNKVVPNKEIIKKELNDNYVIIAENIQCYMKILGIKNSYEMIKDLTRKEHISKDDFFSFIKSLDISPGDKNKLLKLL
jgi:adenylosuccinate lyase